MSNVIHVILPYKHGNLWVFDDSTKGLMREPFVSGADNIINTMAERVGADHSFCLMFSDMPWPGYDYQFDWHSDHLGGNWYTNAEMGTGWLCPALLKYFTTAPDYLYVKVKP